MRVIESRRTAALGGPLEVCDRCGFERPAYNSCHNRHCSDGSGKIDIEREAARQNRRLALNAVPAEQRQRSV